MSFVLNRIMEYTMGNTIKKMNERKVPPTTILA